MCPGRILGGITVAVLTLAVTRWPVAAVGLGALVVWWPALFGGTGAEQRQIASLEALVTWTETLRDTIAAHASLEQAIPASAVHAPTLIRPALVRLVGRLRARVPMDQALSAFAAELDDPSADLVIAALMLSATRRGDRLGEVLTGLTTAAREELEMRRKISAGRVELRRGVQIVVGVTIVDRGVPGRVQRSLHRPVRHPGRAGRPRRRGRHLRGGVPVDAETVRAATGCAVPGPAGAAARPYRSHHPHIGECRIPGESGGEAMIAAVGLGALCGGVVFLLVLHLARPRPAPLVELARFDAAHAGAAAGQAVSDLPPSFGGRGAARGGRGVGGPAADPPRGHEHQPAAGPRVDRPHL